VSVLLSDLEWVRPWGFAGLLLPLVVLILTRLPGRPRTVPVGSFEIWRSLGEENRAQGARRQRRIPLDRWLLVVGLTLGAVALAGPERAQEPPSSELHVIVDRSPSMYLEHEAGGTRLERALARVREFASGDVRWVDATRPGLGRFRVFPAAWLLAPAVDRDEPAWSEFDVPGRLWLTDARPAALPRHAGYAAAGGAEVYGPVASDGTTRYDWAGAELVEVPSGVTRPHVALTGEWPELLREFVRDVWAPERGVSVHSAAREGCVLELRGAPPGAREETSAEVARDGWSASVRARSAGAPLEADGRALEEWLGANTVSGRSVLLSAAPGLVCSALVQMDEPSGDPAAFAVSWSRLFDEHLLRAPGVVPLAERIAVGEEGFKASAELPPGGGGEPAGVSAWLAGAAALFVALSLAARLA